MNFFNDLWCGQDFHVKCEKILQQSQYLTHISSQQLYTPYSSLASQLIFLLHPFLHLTQLIYNALYLVYSLVLSVGSLCCFNFYHSLNCLMSFCTLGEAFLCQFYAIGLAIISILSRTITTLLNGSYTPVVKTSLVVVHEQSESTRLKVFEGNPYLGGKINQGIKDEFRYHQQVLGFV
jgi:hypothetical protein